ncbi:MAG TPA: hypothetical protein PKD05_22330, partial [Candidatus Melainabacteria bacterium]|nr:hypothetical protein [Candidatus Melainabacteria bacterium]
SLDDIGELSLGFDAMTSAGREHGEDDCVVSSALFTAKEEPSFFPHGYVFHLPLGAVIVYTQVAAVYNSSI